MWDGCGRSFSLFVEMSSCPNVLGKGFYFYHHTNFVPFNAPWVIFGYLDQSDFSCSPGCRKLLYMISTSGLKTILNTWNHSTIPPFKWFLEKLSFLMKMDWVKSSQNKELHVQRFFENWESFIALLPTRVQCSIKECFHLTSWFQERLLSGGPPVVCD